MRRLLPALTGLLVAVLCGIAAAHPLAGAPHCPVFPANNPWNQRATGCP